jgi:hypothetical protein
MDRAVCLFVTRYYGVDMEFMASVVDLLSTKGQ